MNPSRLPRIFILLLILVIPFTLLLFFFLNERQFPADAQDDLTQYLTYATVHPSPPTLQATLRAPLPQNFTQALSQTSFGNNFYFQSDDGYGKPPGGKPLPYPPTTLWCLQLTYADAPPRVILLALHEDLYNAEWIIHDIDPSSKTLSRIGCDPLLNP